MWPRIEAILLLAVAAGRAEAAGINLSWDDCGLQGSSFKTFACNTNEGSDALVVSCQLPLGIDGVWVANAHLSLTTSVILPDWWRIRSTLDPPPYPETCRDTLGMRPTHEPQNSPCPAMFPAAPVIVARFGPQDAGNNRLSIVAQVGSFTESAPVAADLEYYVLTLRILHDKTVGGGACAGCEAEACIILDRILVVPGVDEPGTPIEITTTLDRREVTWQSSDIPSCPFAPVPVQQSTWGRVRALYR